MPWYIPLLIFVARIVDVSIGTVRMLLVVGGLRWQAAALGFFEVAIWALAVGKLIQHLEHPLALIGYAGGYATGVLLGSAVESRIAFGFRVVRVISTDLTRDVARLLRSRQWIVTRIDGHGRSGPVEIVFAVIRRRDVPRLMRDVTDADPNAFVTIERAEQPKGGSIATEAAGAALWNRFGGLATLRK